VTKPIETDLKIGKCFKIEDAPKLFETLGLKDIRISGFYTPFCIDDASLSLQEKKEQISGEYDEPLKQFIQLMKESHPELLTARTITSDEIDELLSLHERKYSDLLRDIENGTNTWRIEGSPSLIISGRK
ncbi:MAG: hypothetical protein QME74_02060, partial [Candidatus Edwardsbacteria bacterium]|nr:hypothetical protein [Candidatus Edwardsbacteria bacterium]